MSNRIDYEIPIVWWNVSLSPPLSSTRGKASEEKIQSVASVINRFIELGYFLICLGEVSTSDIVKLSELLELDKKGFSYVEGADKQGRLYFDTAIIYSTKLQILQQENGRFCDHSIFSIEERNLKIYEKYVFFNSDIGQKLNIFLSHWPSQKRDVSINVTEISIELRKKVHELLEDDENVILMGDYNLEPYSKEIVNHLHTSRDRNYVNRKKKVLYNPCWNLLPVYPDNKIHGTFEYPSNNREWHVLDQVMFSRSFMSNPWIVDDSLIFINDLNKLFPDRQVCNPSDHWPLTAIIGWSFHNE